MSLSLYLKLLTTIAACLTLIACGSGGETVPFENTRPPQQSEYTGPVPQNEDVANFKKYLSDEFVEGDEILLNYHAGDAVYLYKNGKERGKFSGLPFKQALFGIWLGGNPADDSLKEDMLGL